MKKLTMLLSVLFITAAAKTASADPVACALRAELTGKSIHIGLGMSKAKGAGVLSCVNHRGEKTELPIEVRVKGFGLGLGYSKENYKILSTNIGLANGVQDLFGKYVVVEAGIMLGDIGGEASVGLTLNNDALAFNLAVIGKKGVGLEAAADLKTFEIVPLAL